MIYQYQNMGIDMNLEEGEIKNVSLTHTIYFETSTEYEAIIDFLRTDLFLKKEKFIKNVRTKSNFPLQVASLSKWKYNFYSKLMNESP